MRGKPLLSVGEGAGRRMAKAVRDAADRATRRGAAAPGRPCRPVRASIASGLRVESTVPHLTGAPSAAFFLAYTSRGASDGQPAPRPARIRHRCRDRHDALRNAAVRVAGAQVPNARVGLAGRPPPRRLARRVSWSRRIGIAVALLLVAGGSIAFASQALPAGKGTSSSSAPPHHPRHPRFSRRRRLDPRRARGCRGAAPVRPAR